MHPALPDKFRTWADTALSFIYPDECQLCHAERATLRQGYVGENCRAEVRWIEAPFCERCGLPFQGEITGEFECTNCREMELHFASARSAVIARGPVLEAVHHYKYDGQMWFEDFLVELLVPRARPWFLQHATDALVPVPLFSVRQRERGFNQAERLAKRLGETVAVPVRADLLKRVQPTPSQTRLSRTERADNMRHAFALRKPQKLNGGCYVLIDDVFTTGATAACATELLVASGHAVQSVVTLAAATRWFQPSSSR
jgi:ComF family protein